MQKHENLVDLVKSFPTNLLFEQIANSNEYLNFLQNLASIQKRTSLVKFVHLAEKSEKGLISNLSTKVARRVRRASGGVPEGASPLPAVFAFAPKKFVHRTGSAPFSSALDTTTSACAALVGTCTWP